jgi:hypothetical protein
MSDKYILNDKGEIEACDDVYAWGQWFQENDEARRVGKDTVNKGTETEADVSTMFLGLDHRFGSGPPLLFETMVFGGPHDEWQDRYSTKAEAEAGHHRIVDLLKSGEALP